MKKEEEGIVIETDGCMAKVKVGRHSDCKNCGSCPGDRTMVLDAQNPIGAVPGQHVAFEIKEANMLKAAFVVFILPLIAIFMGSAAGEYVAQKTGQPVRWFEVCGGFIVFISAIVYIKFFDKSTGNNSKVQPTITRRLTGY